MSHSIGDYYVADCIKIHKIEYQPKNDKEIEWFKMPYGYLKISSCYYKKIERIVIHNDKIDWDATFYFLKAEIYNEIENLFKQYKTV